MARKDWKAGRAVLDQGGDGRSLRVINGLHGGDRAWEWQCVAAEVFDVAVEALELLNERGLEPAWGRRRDALLNRCRREPVHTYGQTEGLLQSPPVISYVVNDPDVVNRLLAEVRELKNMKRDAEKGLVAHRALFDEQPGGGVMERLTELEEGLSTLQISYLRLVDIQRQLDSTQRLV